MIVRFYRCQMLGHFIRKRHRRVLRLYSSCRRRILCVLFVGLVLTVLLGGRRSAVRTGLQKGRVLAASEPSVAGVQSDASGHARSGNSHFQSSSTDKCHVVGLNPADPVSVHLNTRVLCSLTPVCFRGDDLTRDLIVVRRRGSISSDFPSCVVSAAQSGDAKGSSREVLVDNGTCEVLRYYGLACAHGEGTVDGMGHPLNNCTRQKVIDESELARLDAAGAVLWHEGVSVLVPSYAWVYNIYHYGRELNFVAHVVRHLRRYLARSTWDRVMSSPPGSPERSLRVVFRLRGYYPDSWHVNITNVFFRNILQKSAGHSFSVHPEPSYLFSKPPKELVCMRSAIVLGAEGATDSLQFLNDSSITSSPPDIPHDAIEFKESVYKELGLPHQFARKAPNHTYSSIAVPPATVGYAVREVNSSRKFPPHDEAWFRRMLRTESRRYGLEFMEISIPVNLSLREQVREVQQVGFLAGLHGANLVNSMFMRPGAALFEIFPFKYVKMFYLNGGNSGLRYSSYEVETSDDRNCTAYKSLSCQILYRDVVVNLTLRDRAAIAQHIRDGMEYIVQLRRAHPSGYFSVRSGSSGGLYRINGFHFPRSSIALDQFASSFGERDPPPDGRPYVPKSTKG